MKIIQPSPNRSHNEKDPWNIRLPQKKLFFVCVLVTCLVRGPSLATHAAVLLLGWQGFQDNVGGPETRQRDVGQVGERMLLGKQLAGFPPLAQESALGEQHYPLPVTAVVVFV